MRLTLPGQLDLPDTPERLAELAQSKAAAPLRVAVNQLPCDQGLFSDEANQLDLIEMLMDQPED